MTSGLLTIADHPTDLIEINGQKCGRNGRYKKTMLAETYGSDVMPLDLIGSLASDCEFRGGLNKQGCGAIYLALLRGPLERR